MGVSCASARSAMRSLLDSGLRGTFDAFAKRAGVPESLASQTLRHLCLEQAAAVHGKDTSRRVGRPRAIYGPPHAPVLDALSFASQVWR